VYLEDDKGVPQLNVLKILKNYVRLFAQAEPLAALHYIYLVQDIRTRCVTHPPTYHLSNEPTNNLTLPAMSTFEI